MRLSTRARPGRWEKWFAWRPVETDSGFVWLETVWRSPDYYMGAFFGHQYRRIESED